MSLVKFIPKRGVRFIVPHAGNGIFSAKVQQWMLGAPTVFFLDICLIAHIKDCNRSENLMNAHRKESIRELRNIDLLQNFVSYLPALMEKTSDQRSKFSVEDFILEARRDFDAMRAFFKNASVLESWDFVEDYVTNFFGSHAEQSTPAYLKFLNFANDQGLHNKFPEGKRLKIAQLLCAKAKEIGIGTGHPVVLVPIACIYGCDAARLVVKFAGRPENFNPGNALADIQAISRVAGMLTDFVQRAGVHGGPVKIGKFKTADSPLQKMLDYFTVRSVSTEEKSDGVSQRISISFDPPHLFPLLFGPDRQPKDEKSRIELGRLYDLLVVEIPV